MVAEMEIKHQVLGCKYKPGKYISVADLIELADRSCGMQEVTRILLSAKTEDIKSLDTAIELRGLRCAMDELIKLQSSASESLASIARSLGEKS